MNHWHAPKVVINRWEWIAILRIRWVALDFFLCPVQSLINLELEYPAYHLFWDQHCTTTGNFTTQRFQMCRSLMFFKLQHMKHSENKKVYLTKSGFFCRCTTEAAKSRGDQILQKSWFSFNSGIQFNIISIESVRSRVGGGFRLWHYRCHDSSCLVSTAQCRSPFEAVRCPSVTASSLLLFHASQL